MIELKREGRTCTVKLDTSIDFAFNFTHTCSDEAYASFLRQDLIDKMWKTFEEIRRRAYNDGWNDNRKRNIKKTWFSGHAKIL